MLSADSGESAGVPHNPGSTWLEKGTAINALSLYEGRIRRSLEKDKAELRAVQNERQSQTLLPAQAPAASAFQSMHHAPSPVLEDLTLDLAELLKLPQSQPSVPIHAEVFRASSVSTRRTQREPDAFRPEAGLAHAPTPSASFVTLS